MLRGRGLALSWPPLPLDDWRPTQETLQLWTQVVGKVRLALTRLTNHWWNCTLHATPRGLTTGLMHHGATPVEIAFDFVDQRLVVDVGPTRRFLPLEPRSVADFHRELMTTLADQGVPVRIHPLPQEIADPIPFPDDDTHAAYDGTAVARFHQALLLADQALRRWRAAFLGKCSPVHFFWGSFDLAVTRFSGRPAPPHPAGIPHIADWVVREAYSHECASAGWWPGNGGFGRPAFYAYAYPEPDGYRSSRSDPELDGARNGASLRPAAAPPTRAALPGAAYYDDTLREYLLPWDDVVASSDPRTTVAAFLDATYDRVAAAGRWDPGLVRTPAEAERLEQRLRATTAARLDRGP